VPLAMAYGPTRCLMSMGLNKPCPQPPPIDNNDMPGNNAYCMQNSTFLRQRWSWPLLVLIVPTYERMARLILAAQIPRRYMHKWSPISVQTFGKSCVICLIFAPFGPMIKRCSQRSTGTSFITTLFAYTQQLNMHCWREVFNRQW